MKTAAQTNDGAGRPLVAVRKALCTRLGILLTSFTSARHLVIAAMRGT